MMQVWCHFVYIHVYRHFDQKFVDTTVTTYPLSTPPSIKIRSFTLQMLAELCLQNIWLNFSSSFGFLSYFIHLCWGHGLNQHL